LARTVLVAAVLASGLVHAEDEPIERRVRQLEEKLADHERLKQEVDDLKRQLRGRNEAEPSAVSKERSPAAEARSPFFLRVGHGTAELGGLLQVWALHSALDPDDFRLRRSEIKLSGTIIDPIGYTVMIDPAKNLSENKTIIAGGDPVTLSQPRSDGKILQDLFLSLRFAP
jgi:hypothetical protein